MISRNDILQVGHLQKPHGIKGEITLFFHKAGYADIDTEYYFLEIDGIPVPFFIEEFTFHTDVTARVKFEGVDDEKQASRYTGLKVFLLCKMVREADYNEDEGWDFFIGYSVVDRHVGQLGVIEHVDDSTMNILLVIRDGQQEYLVPATEDFITSVDNGEKTILMNLPEGLIEK